MNLKLDVRGNRKQLECIKTWSDNNISDIVYGGSKGSAKSFTGCFLMIADALLYAGVHLFVARKNLGDLIKFTIPSMYEVLDVLNIGHSVLEYKGGRNVFEFNNGSKIFFIHAKYIPSDPMFMRFGSMQMTRGWIEEAGEFDVNAKNNLMSTVGRWKNDEYNINGKVLQTCNPAKNYLYNEYYLKNKNGTIESHKKFIQALPTDNKMLAKGYLEHLNNILSTTEKKRLLFGEWEYDDDPNVLCDYENIIRIFDNDHIETPKDKYITGDIARMGSDKAIILIWQGWKIIEYYVFEKSKLNELQNHILSLRLKHNVPKSNVILDEDGMGAGIVDNLGVEGFVNGSRALNDENYNSLQSQCSYGLAEKIQNKEIFFSCDIDEKYKNEIIEELEQLKSYNIDSDTKLKILPKSEIKKNIGRSPDWRDALMMRKYFDLKKPARMPKARLI